MLIYIQCDHVTSCRNSFKEPENEPVGLGELPQRIKQEFLFISPLMVFVLTAFTITTWSETAELFLSFLIADCFLVLFKG